MIVGRQNAGRTIAYSKPLRVPRARPARRRRRAWTHGLEIDRPALACLVIVPIARRYSRRLSVSAAILAGGRSRRMGRDKAWLDLGDGVPLVRRVADALEQVADEIVVVANDERYASLGLPRVPDRYGEKGAFGGIATAVAATRGELVCVGACDMPWPSPDVYRLLLRLADGHDVAIPRIGDDLETMHAVYRRTCLPAMERALARGDMRVISFFPDVRVREVRGDDLRRADPDLRSFTNLNTPEELERARQEFARRARPA